MTQSNDTLWFVEELQPTGNFAPAVYCGEKPVEKRASHRRKFRRNPVRVPVYLAHLTNAQLRECLSPDGKFRAQYADEIRKGGQP